MKLTNNMFPEKVVRCEKTKQDIRGKKDGTMPKEDLKKENVIWIV